MHDTRDYVSHFGLFSDSYFENENINASVTLKMIRKDRWRIYDLVYLSLSIVDYFEYSYNEKINRAGGLENILKKMLERT